MPKHTIKEIAKIAGVSTSAVSIVLNDRSGVSEHTRNKVKEIVTRLQYEPNPNSRRLIFKKTNNIAVLFKRNLSPLEHLFHSELNRVILHECENMGYNLIYASTAIEDGNVILPSIIKSYDVDGIIFYGDVDQQMLNSINKYNIPYILVDSHLADPNSLSVRADYLEAAYTAACHLISLNHKDIAFIGTNLQPGYGTQTFNGFKKALEIKKLELPINWIQFDAKDEESAFECMENILSYSKTPSAVFCAADIYAVGVIKCLRSHDYDIPNDISVIGIDDILLSKYIEPSLTTVKIDKEEMGKIAIKMLIKKIEKQDVCSQVVCSNNLMIRNSTKAINK